MNKNPSNNLDQKNQKPENPFGSKFSKNLMKNLNACNINKKEGQRSLTKCLGEKPLKL